MSGRLLVGRGAGSRHGHRAAVRIGGHAGRRRVRLRQAVKSFPITIVMSANPDGTSVTPSSPTPSALRARRASATCSSPPAITTVVFVVERVRVLRQHDAEPLRHDQGAATSAAMPGSPTPFCTSTGTGGVRAPKSRAIERVELLEVRHARRARAHVVGNVSIDGPRRTGSSLATASSWSVSGRSGTATGPRGQERRQHDLPPREGVRPVDARGTRSPACRPA